MMCAHCEGASVLRVEGIPTHCPHCRNGVVQPGPYHPNSAVGCATLAPIGSIDPALSVPWSETYVEKRDARTDELTGHGTRPGNLTAALCKDLKRQLDAVSANRGELVLSVAKTVEERDLARRERDEAVSLLAESVRAGEEKDGALRELLFFAGKFFAHGQRMARDGRDLAWRKDDELAFCRAVDDARAALNQAKGCGNG